jgi:glycosyltransferase involved in cell wall biosynthesis
VGIKKINIAIFVSSDLESGGGHQYEYMVLHILKKYHKNKSIELKFYGFSAELQKDFSGIDINISIIKENIFQKIHRISLSNLFFYKIFSKIRMSLCSIEKKLASDKIDLVYFLSPSLVSQALNNIPYIFTLWDLGHLEELEFPELTNDRKFESRELIYTKSLKKAFKVIVDSAYSKQYTANKYNLDEKRVEVLKFLPNIRVADNEVIIDIKNIYNLKNDYIYYPAQFWAHKNHIYILKAIKILRETKNIDIDVVFSGSNKGNLRYILNKAKQFGVDDLIHYVGFVPNSQIPCLYKQSLSLVMPTYLGPTNIPPLEAFFYKTPVCYSDKPSFREQVRDAVFYMDLKDPNSLVENIITIKNNKELVDYKVHKGLEILSSWSEEDFYKSLLTIFGEYQYIRDGWE